MALQIGPHIVFHLMGANSMLHFLSDAFQYKVMNRPNILSISRSIKTVLSKAKTVSTLESFIFPGRPQLRTQIVAQNPLLRQQVEWNVRQVC